MNNAFTSYRHVGNRQMSNLSDTRNNEMHAGGQSESAHTRSQYTTPYASE